MWSWIDFGVGFFLGAIVVSMLTVFWIIFFRIKAKTYLLSQKADEIKIYGEDGKIVQRIKVNDKK